MQDRFKFRIFDKEQKKIVTTPRHFNFGIVNETVVLLESCPTVAGFYNKRIVKEYNDVILMQSTGLKDKNDKLIYEGDIVKYFCPAEYCSDGLHKCPECYSGENGSVYYDEDLAMYEYRSKSDECPLTDNINTEEDLEIIGNIYENPELLEEINSWKK